MAFGGGGSNRVSIAIDATNNASGVIGQVSRDLGGLQAQGTSGGLLGNLGNTAALAGLAAGVGMVGAAAYDLGNNAARVDQMRVSFEGLAKGVGGSSEEMLAAMKGASAGTISEENLILGANKALLLGVADNADELVAILSVAKSRGEALGLDVTQSFDNLVTGIGRSSVEILDNLGFTPQQIAEANEAYAASLGITADEMDSAAKKAAILNVVMGEAANIGAIPETALASYQRLDAEMDNLKTNLGDLVQPATGGGAELAANVLGSVNEGLDFIQRDSLAVEQRLAEIGTAMQGAQLRFQQNLQLVQAGQGTPEVMQAYIDSLQELGDLTREQKELQAELDGVTRSSAGSWIPVGEQVAAAADEQRNLNSVVSEVTQGWNTNLAEQAAAMQSQALQAQALAAAEEAAAARIVAARESAQAGRSAAASALTGLGTQGDTGGLGATVEAFRTKGTEAGAALVDAAASQVEAQTETLQTAGATSAASFIASFTATLGQQTAGFVASGARSGMLWGNAFLSTVSEGVPSALIDILANLVTPKVRANLASDSGRTRAA